MPADRSSRARDYPAVQHERARRPGSQPPLRLGFFNRAGFAQSLYYQSVGVGYMGNSPLNYDNPPYQPPSPSPPQQLEMPFPNYQQSGSQMYPNYHPSYHPYNIPLQNQHLPPPSNQGFRAIPLMSPLNQLHALQLQALNYGLGNMRPDYLQPRYFSPPTIQHDGAGPSNAPANQLVEMPRVRTPLYHQREPEQENASASGRQHANIEELYNAIRLEFLDRQIRESVLLRLESRNDFDELGQFLEDTVKWVRRAAVSENIPYSEQKNLLLNNWRELLLVTTAENNYRFNAKRLISRLAAERPNIEDEVTRLMTIINRVMILSMDQTEFDCLKKIVIFRTEIPFLCTPTSRDDLQERALFALYKYNAKDYPFRVGKTLLLLPSVCFVAQTGLLECLLFKIPCDLTTLLLTWLSREQHQQQRQQ